MLDLYAPSPDLSQLLLVTLAAGLAALLAGGTLLIWAASRWLVAPLRRMNTQVDAIAGGDPIETPATSPIREVEYVAQAIAGMGAKLAQTAEQDSRLETERRLFVSPSPMTCARRCSRCAATSTRSQQASATRRRPAVHPVGVPHRPGRCDLRGHCSGRDRGDPRRAPRRRCNPRSLNPPRTGPGNRKRRKGYIPGGQGVKGSRGPGRPHQPSRSGRYGAGRGDAGGCDDCDR